MIIYTGSYWLRVLFAAQFHHHARCRILKCSLSTDADYYNTYAIMISSRSLLGDLLFTRMSTHHCNINMYLYRPCYTI